MMTRIQWMGWLLTTMLAVGGCTGAQQTVRAEEDPVVKRLESEQSRLAMRMSELADALLDVKSRMEGLDARLQAVERAGAEAAAKTPAARETPALEVIRVEPPAAAPPPAAAGDQDPVTGVGNEAPLPPVAPPTSVRATEVDGEAAKLYHKAFGFYRQGNFARAILDFEEFIQRHPTHEYADSAQYWLGEGYFSQGLFEQAVVEFSRVLENYPHGVRASDAAYMVGMCYEELGQADKAKVFFEKTIADHPGTEAAFKAAKKLQEG